jgi:hypothetical protein
MSKLDAAQLVAGLAITLLTLVLAITGRKDFVALGDVELNDGMTPDAPVPDAPAPDATGITRKIAKGHVIPADQVDHVRQPTLVGQRKRSWLGAIVAGTDHRASTSKTVVFAWTLAVAFGLLSLLVAVWLGDHAPWDAQVRRGLQEEYLLLLGGPFAAAVLAKYAANTQAASKISAPVGEAGLSQLVNNDQGDTDLGDFQYVLFNVIGLAFFLGAFITHLSGGFPDLPPILTGLLLTSTGGYAAKKLLAQASPTLTSVLPAAAIPGGTVQVFGTNLSVPASVSGTGRQIDATVLTGQRTATVIAHDLILGNDRLTIKIDDDVPPGSAPITATRADGVVAAGPAGTNGLAFEVLKPAD